VKSYTVYWSVPGDNRIGTEHLEALTPAKAIEKCKNKMADIFKIPFNEIKIHFVKEYKH
jgi:ribosomal protein L20A (L18A)